MNYSWKRAIAIWSALALIMIFGTVTIAWLRRPRVALPSKGPSAPLLYTEEDGSVYDLHLKMTQLEERLLAGETRTQHAETELARLREERAALITQLRTLERQVKALRAKLEEQSAPRPSPQTTPVEPPNGPATVPTNSPDSSTPPATTPPASETPAP